MPKSIKKNVKSVNKRRVNNKNKVKYNIKIGGKI